MRIFIISRTDYDEPKRVRQQLADMLATEYEVVYCQPNSLPGSDVDMRFLTFRLFQRFSSIPLIGMLNAFFINTFLLKNVRGDDVVINFMPEFALTNFKRCKIISFINDDFSAMAPRVTKPWLKYLIDSTVKKSDYALFSSLRLKEKYRHATPSRVFYPWAQDSKHFTMGEVKRNRIVFWGYIGDHVDFAKTEDILKYIRHHKLDYVVEFYGPVSNKAKDSLSRLEASFNNFHSFFPVSFEELKPQTIVCALEVLLAEEGFGDFIEVPNKAPNFLKYGIPLAYAGVELLDLPCFIKIETVDAFFQSLKNDTFMQVVKCSALDFTNNNGSESRRELLNELIG